MSADMRRWCEAECSRLNADFTLVEYCYSIDNPVEVKETLFGYLGFKPAVTAFAEEFIRRKGTKTPASAQTAAAARDTGTEWQEVAPSPLKGGAKKKTGAAGR